MRKLSENICRKLLKLLIVESNQHFLNPLADPLGINPPWTPFGRRPQFENHCARGRCVCGSVAAVLQGTTWVVYSKLLSPAAAAAATMAFRHIDWSFVDRTRGGGNVARRQWSQTMNDTSPPRASQSVRALSQRHKQTACVARSAVIHLASSVQVSAAATDRENWLVFSLKASSLSVYWHIHKT